MFGLDLIYDTLKKKIYLLEVNTKSVGDEQPTEKTREICVNMMNDSFTIIEDMINGHISMDVGGFTLLKF